MQIWEHQRRALELIETKRNQGVRRLCVQGPTGCGKTITFKELALREVASGGRVVIYTNRKTIRSQISDVLSDFDIWHGVRAAGCRPNLNRDIQVSSIMTERARGFKKDSRWSLHDATLVICDEAHSQKAETACRILHEHFAKGAFITGWSATPVGISHLYDDIITMATLAELREAGVLVRCDVFAPDEIDMRGVKITCGEFNQSQMKKRVKDTIVVGNVIEHWEQLNPDKKPTVLFAPGVSESQWFVSQFEAFNYKAAHVDAKTTDRKRRIIFDAWANGEYDIVCNFGVLREGFDLRSCSHAILCQPTNRVSTYLQIAGRILRSNTGKTSCVLQDHVGAYWRHGSPNADRDWRLEDTDSSIARSRRERKRKESSSSEAICPKCKAVRFYVPGADGACYKCGFKGHALARIVRQTNGRLVRIDAKVPSANTPVVERTLKSCIYAGVHKGFSAAQVMSMANRKLGYWPTQKHTSVYIPRPGSYRWYLRAEEVWKWAKKK